MRIGVTERGDAAVNLEWYDWVEAGNPAILITKNPASLAFHLFSRHIPDKNIIVHGTITGFGGSKVEPNVHHYNYSMDNLKMIGEKIGNDRIVLRIDPIVPTIAGQTRAMRVLDKYLSLMRQFRIRISFLDNYNHVVERFQNAGLNPLRYKFHESVAVRKKIKETLEEYASQSIEVCGEPEMECTGCISDKDCEILGVKPVATSSKQRSACKCLGMKHELLSKRARCKHGCLYCYWKDK